MNVRRAVPGDEAVLAQLNGMVQAMRRRGVARALVDASPAWAREPGVERVSALWSGG